MDKYKNFAELERNEREGEDYTILYRELESNIAIMAPHGGGIEPGTIDIADALAGSDYTFYGFKGMKKRGNKILHMTSSRYDEPMGLKISKNASTVISIHGAHDKGEKIFIGGCNQELKQKLTQALIVAGFRAEISDVPGMRGMKSENICNRCKTGKGVQLEISRGLREKMFENLDRRSLRKKRNIFYDFVTSLKTALLCY